MAIAQRWGFQPLRRSCGLLYPGGFSLQYEGKRYFPEHLEELVLLQQTPQQWAALHEYLDVVASDLSEAGHLLHGANVSAAFDDDGIPHRIALSQFYAAWHGLQHVLLGGAKAQLAKGGAMWTPVLFTGVVAPCQNLSAELREYSRYAFIPQDSRKQQKPLLTLGVETLDEVLDYAPGAVYEVQNVPTCMTKDLTSLSRILHRFYHRLREHCYAADEPLYAEELLLV